MCEPIGFAKQLLIIVTSSFKKPAGIPPSDLEGHQINSGDGPADRPGHQIILGTVRPTGRGIKLIHKHTNQLLKAFLNKLVEDFNANLTFDKGAMSFDKSAMPLRIIAEITLLNQEEIIMGWLWFRFTHRGLFNSCSNIVFGFNLHV